MKTYHQTICIDNNGNLCKLVANEKSISIDIAKFNHFSNDRSQRRHLQSLASRELLDGSLMNLFPNNHCDSWILSKSNTGKPFLNGQDSPAISISHSDDWCACVIGMTPIIGIDLEVIKARDWNSYCTDVFHPVEFRWVLESSGKERDIRGLICWCRKEAIVKALGVGISVDLSKIGFSSEGALIAIPKELGGILGWKFFIKILRDELVVAVAWRNQPPAW